MPPRNMASRSGQLCTVSVAAAHRVQSAVPVVHVAAGTQTNACEGPETVNEKLAAPLRTDNGFLRKYQCIPGGRRNPTSCAKGGSSPTGAVGNPWKGMSSTASPGCGEIESEQSSETLRLPKAAGDPGAVTAASGEGNPPWRAGPEQPAAKIVSRQPATDT